MSGLPKTLGLMVENAMRSRVIRIEGEDSMNGESQVSDKAYHGSQGRNGWRRWSPTQRDSFFEVPEMGR